MNIHQELKKVSFYLIFQTILHYRFTKKRKSIPPIAIAPVDFGTAFGSTTFPSPLLRGPKKQPVC
ncbi:MULTISPECIES: hypothetical protein [Nostoc]|uniref:hypothetical protein n=1 Tax=Nostoc TaxID=1177 RepID=UPI001F54F81E|nr:MULTISPECIES: hypothetical protein [Nostoc]